MFSWMDAYTQFVAVSILINALLVLSMFVVFQCGVLSLASIGFMADGAYTAALLSTKGHWPAVPAIIGGAVLAGALAAVFGRLVLHIRGVYLALGTFALGQVCVLGIANFGFTGGPQGVTGIPVDVTFGELVIVVAGAGVLFEILHRSYVGRALRAARLDERVAEGVGVNVVRYQLVAFVASGTLAGLAGGLEAFRTGVISPDQYNFTLLVQILAVAMIGGSYYWLGGVGMAVAIGVLRQYIGSTSSLWEGFLYGGLLIFVMLAAPNGVADPRLFRLLRRRMGRRSAGASALVAPE